MFANSDRRLPHGWLGQRSTTPGTRRPWPARHGSGAMAPDPMDIGPTRRTQRSPSPGRHSTRYQPGGPLTANEWSDQVEWLQRQLTSQHKTVADHAHLLGQLTTTTLPAANVKIDNLAASVLCRFCKYEMCMPSHCHIWCCFPFLSRSGNVHHCGDNSDAALSWVVQVMTSQHIAARTPPAHHPCT